MYGQEYGAILPNNQQNPLDTFIQLKQYKDQEQRYQDQLARQQREYQDNLMTQAMGQLDFKRFATGTPLDPVIQASLNASLKSISQKIKDNQDVTSASIYYDASNAVNDISSYAMKAKNIRGGIEEGYKQFLKDASIDANKLHQTAITNAFMKYDPNSHSFIVKDPSEIDDSVDWISETLKSNPEKVVKGSGALNMLLKGADKKNYEKGGLVNRGGVRRNVVYKGEYFPYNKIEIGKDGFPVFDPQTGQAKIGIRSENFNGTPMSTDEDLQYFTSTPGANVYLSSLVKQFGVDPNSEEGATLKKILLYEYLSKNNQGYINNVKFDIDDSQLQSQNFRREMKAYAQAISGALGGKRYQNSALTGVIGALGGNQSFYDPSNIEKDANGNELINITPYIPGGALFSGKVKKNADGTASKEAFAGVMINPKTNTLVFKDVDGYETDAMGMPKKDALGNTVLKYSYRDVPIGDELGVIQKLGEANGLSKDEATKLYNTISDKRKQQGEIVGELEKTMSQKPKGLFQKMLGSWLYNPNK